MTVRIGTDICSVKRLEEAYARYGERLLNRILTDTEKQYVLQNKHHLARRLAARFAAKEAVAKALGTGFHGISWREIEITREASGRPVLKLYAKAKLKAKELGVVQWQLSLSREREYALAVVLGHII